MVDKVLFILMPFNFQDHEFKKPHDALQKAGYHVDVAGLQPGIAKGKMGLEVTPNLQLATMKNADFDSYTAVVIPGGPGSTKYLWDNKQIVETVRYFAGKKKLVAAICHGCPVLAQAGILKGKTATTFPSDEAKSEFKKHGVNFIDQGCYILPQERIITAQSPANIAEFIAAILSQLKTNKTKES